MKGLYGALLLPLLMLGACDRSQETAGTGTGAQDTSPETALPGDWRKTQQQRRNQLERYLQQEEIAYRWFADFPFGLNDGVPYIILKLLPKLAPELWGGEDNFLEPVGLFHDQRLPDYISPFEILSIVRRCSGMRRTVPSVRVNVYACRTTIVSACRLAM